LKKENIQESKYAASYVCLDEDGRPIKNLMGTAIDISQGGLLLETICFAVNYYSAFFSAIPNFVFRKMNLSPAPIPRLSTNSFEMMLLPLFPTLIALILSALPAPVRPLWPEPYPQQPMHALI
jgi:hypothetical protein